MNWNVKKLLFFSCVAEIGILNNVSVIVSSKFCPVKQLRKYKCHDWSGANAEWNDSTMPYEHHFHKMGFKQKIWMHVLYVTCLAWYCIVTIPINTWLHWACSNGAPSSDDCMLLESISESALNDLGNSGTPRTSGINSRSLSLLEEF